MKQIQCEHRLSATEWPGEWRPLSNCGVLVCDCSVYCNGKQYEPSRRVVLTKRMLSQNLPDIFAEISQHINSDFGVVTKYVVSAVRLRHCESPNSWSQGGCINNTKEVIKIKIITVQWHCTHCETGPLYVSTPLVMLHFCRTDSIVC